MKDPLVTIFKNIRETTAGYNRKLSYVLERIKSETDSEKIGLIRNEQNKKFRDALKQDLLSICFSGTFTSRTDSGIKEHSGLICLDFDGFENEIVLAAQREEFSKWEYSHSIFTSPSGKGLKVLVRIPQDKEKHTEYFDAIREELDNDYFDPTSRNLSRVCYISYDPDLYYNEDSYIWTKTKEKSIELNNEKIIIPMTDTGKIIDRLNSWWTARFGMTSGSRNKNLYVLAVAFNEYGVPKSDAEHFCVSNYERKDFDAKEIQNVIKSAYKNSSNFGIKTFNDNELESKAKQMIRKGESINEIQAEITNIDPRKVKRAVRELKENMTVSDFWTYSDRGKLILVPHNYKYFLEQNRFGKYFPSEKDFIFITINENTVEVTNSDKIKDFVLDYLENRTDSGYAPYDFMANSTKFFKSDYLSFIKTVDLQLNKDTEKSCYLYFKNCAVKVTKSTVKEIDYVDLDGFVWKNQIIDREWNPSASGDKEVGQFETFVNLIAGQDKGKFESFKSVAGYLMHSFKSSMDNRAIIFNDETISNNPNGGSGKGLFMSGIGHIKRTAVLDGKRFDFNDRFAYQSVAADDQIVIFDDVKKNFPFENLFSLITEGLYIEKKNKEAYHVPIQDSPKVVITTNYTVGGVGGSFERRKFEVEMSSYFNSGHTPFDEFDCELFSSWDEREWDLFHWFMIDCVQFYLKNGLVAHEFKNLKLRKFIKETSIEFAEWSGIDKGVIDRANLPFNCKIDKKLAHLDFIEQHQDFKSLAQRTFTRWTEVLASYAQLEYESGRDGDLRWFRLKEKENIDWKQETLRLK